MPPMISNAPLREAFERGNLTIAQLANRLGYTRRDHGYSRADEQTVLRQLGLRAYRARGRLNPPQRYVMEKTALRYAVALGLDPVDIDL